MRGCDFILTLIRRSYRAEKCWTCVPSSRIIGWCRAQRSSLIEAIRCIGSQLSNPANS